MLPYTIRCVCCFFHWGFRPTFEWISYFTSFVPHLILLDLFSSSKECDRCMNIFFVNLFHSRVAYLSSIQKIFPFWTMFWNTFSLIEFHRSEGRRLTRHQFSVGALSPLLFSVSWPTDCIEQSPRLVKKLPVSYGSLGFVTEFTRDRNFVVTFLSFIH